MYEGYAVAGEIRTLADDPLRTGAMAGARRMAYRMDQRTTTHARTLGRCHYALAADHGYCVNIADMDAVRTGFAFYTRPVCFGCRRVAYLFAGPLLVVEQFKRQLAIIHEAQRARGVPLDESRTNVYAPCQH